MPEYKALTFIHFPFTDRSFSPGEMIDRSEFEEYAEAAAQASPPTDEYSPTSAQETIDEFLQFGSISEDPEAQLHPDHIPPDPTKPTLGLLIEQAKEMVATLDAHGQDVPQELRQLAETDYQHVQAVGDAGTGGDRDGNT